MQCPEMRARQIYEVVEKGGRRPVSKWINDNLDAKARAKLESRFNRIEVDQTINPNWLKPYVSLQMWELRFSDNGREIRFLCEKTDKETYVMLVAATKKTKLTKQEEDRACRLRDLIKKGTASVSSYPLAFRA